jgi:hypothetical protein
MCLVPKADTPDAPRAVLPREAPKRVDEATQLSRFRTRQEEMAKRGLRSVYRSGPGGLAKPAMTAPKALLGE